MSSNDKARIIREKILNEFYSSSYQKAFFQRDIQGLGIDWFERSIEKFWSIKSPNNVLEIGGGSGEHLKYLKYIPKGSYISLDLRPHFTLDHLRGISSDLLSK